MMMKGHTIEVLDHGYVKFIASMGDDETVIESARMSTGRGFISWEPYERCKTCGCPWRRIHNGLLGVSGDSYSLMPGFQPKPCCDNVLMTTERFPRGDFGLLERLYISGHSTPTEMCELAVEVQAPLLVLREWHRHRTQSYSEFSARYAQMPDLHYVPAMDRFTPKFGANKQESSIAVGNVNPAVLQKQIVDAQAAIYDDYDAMLTVGVPKEVARINTPVSRYSKMRAKTDLRNWLGFLKLRMAPDAQWEIRQYGNAIAEIVKKIWPRTWSLFEEHTLYAKTLSRCDVEEMKELLRGDRYMPRESTKEERVLESLQQDGPRIRLSETFLAKFK